MALEALSQSAGAEPPMLRHCTKSSSGLAVTPSANATVGETIWTSAMVVRSTNVQDYGWVSICL